MRRDSRDSPLATPGVGRMLPGASGCGMNGRPSRPRSSNASGTLRADRAGGQGQAARAGASGARDAAGQRGRAGTGGRVHAARGRHRDRTLSALRRRALAAARAARCRSAGAGDAGPENRRCSAEQRLSRATVTTLAVYCLRHRDLSARPADRGRAAIARGCRTAPNARRLVASLGRSA